jgi:hypothetical protein
MVNALDKAMGIVERTSAEAGDGVYFGGMPTVRGFFWAAAVEGEKVAAFEMAPGNVIFGLTSENVRSVKKVMAGLNIIVQVVYGYEDGEPMPIVIIGPRGRVKKIFAYIGYEL